jgi:ABC-type multidrug transport system permease subunit
MSSSLNLRIAAIFILFTSSFLGVIIPVYGSNGEFYEKILPLLQASAAGIMLGLSLVRIHLKLHTI